MGTQLEAFYLTFGAEERISNWVTEMIKMHDVGLIDVKVANWRSISKHVENHIEGMSAIGQLRSRQVQLRVKSALLLVHPQAKTLDQGPFVGRQNMPLLV
jgi:hypothetical protein